MSTGKRLEPINEPWIRRSCSSCSGSSSIFRPGLSMPITVAVPPRANMAKACSAVCLRPMHSKAWCTPPRVSSITCLAASPSRPLIRSVAPNCLASSSFESSMSMAMIRPAPASAAPLMAARPMPPHPITATVSPGRTLAVLNTAPVPVVTAQPSSAARSSGMSRRIATQAFSCTSICSANPDRLTNCGIGLCT
ncbi:hypothetical protein D3C81_1444850 [compost metagenome]